MKKRLPDLLFEAACFLLVLLFVYTGCSKLLTGAGFREQLELVPWLKAFARPLAVLLPVAELATGVALVFPASRKAGAWSAALLMSAFSLYTGWMLVLPAAERPCSCGGVLRQLSWTQHAWFNGSFTVTAWTAVYISCTRKRE